MVSIDSGSSGVALRPHSIVVDVYARTVTVVAVPKGTVTKINRYCGPYDRRGRIGNAAICALAPKLVALEGDARLKQRLGRQEAQMQINDRSGTLVGLWLTMTLPHAAVV
jgi:hypothetical protein